MSDFPPPYPIIFVFHKTGLKRPKAGILTSNRKLCNTDIGWISRSSRRICQYGAFYYLFSLPFFFCLQQSHALPSVLRDLLNLSFILTAILWVIFARFVYRNKKGFNSSWNSLTLTPPLLLNIFVLNN